jgi:hypothetical protein
VPITAEELTGSIYSREERKDLLEVVRVSH